MRWLMRCGVLVAALVCVLAFAFYLREDAPPQKGIESQKLSSEQLTIFADDQHLRCIHAQDAIPAHPGDRIVMRIEPTPSGYISTLVINGQDTRSRCVAMYGGRDIF